MDLDKIIQQAQEEKDKKIRRESELAAKKAVTKKSFLHSWNERLVPYRIFRKFNYKGSTWIFGLCIVLIFTCYFIPFGDFEKDSIFPSLLTGASIGLGLLFLALFIGIELATFFQYARFKNLHASLPFELKGWEEAISKKEFLDFENWWISCRLDIELEGQAQTMHKEKEALNALCFLTCKKCNRNWYTPFSWESRTLWTSNGTSLEGSANVYVLAELYKFLNRELKPFQNQTKIIKKITLTGDNQFTSISRETSD